MYQLDYDKSYPTDTERLIFLNDFAEELLGDFHFFSKVGTVIAQIFYNIFLAGGT